MKLKNIILLFVMSFVISSCGQSVQEGSCVNKVNKLGKEYRESDGMSFWAYQARVEKEALPLCKRAVGDDIDFADDNAKKALLDSYLVVGQLDDFDSLYKSLSSVIDRDLIVDYAKVTCALMIKAVQTSKIAGSLTDEQLNVTMRVCEKAEKLAK